MTLESRHLGVIDLRGGVGGSSMDSSLELGGSHVPFRLEIDHPQRFDETAVKTIDFALDGLARLESSARQTIASGLRRESSSASTLLRSWKAGANPDDDSLEFLADLRLAQVKMLPDGGRAQRERVVFAYELASSPALGRLVVRVLEPTGPELDPIIRRTI